MKVLFDQGTPVPLRKALAKCTVHTAYELGWHELSNGELIAKAEENSFEVLVSTDQNLKYQQNLERRSISIVILMTASWPRIRSHEARIVSAITSIRTGEYIEIPI